MEGNKSSIGSFPENLVFDHGSSSNPLVTGQQICWNNLRNSAQNQLPNYASPISASNLHLTPARQGHNLSGWSIGEPISTSIMSQASNNERTLQATSSSVARQSVPVYLLSDGHVNPNHNQTVNNPLCMEGSSSNSIAADCHLCSAFASSRVYGRTTEILNDSVPSQNFPTTTASSSSNPFGVSYGDGGILPCKRKAIELNVGQTSENASSGLWHSVPSRPNSRYSSRVPNPSEGFPGAAPSHQDFGVVSGNPVALSVEEFSQRNVRSRSSISHQQNSGLASAAIANANSVGHSNLSSPYASSPALVPLNDSVQLTSLASTANISVIQGQGQSLLPVPPLRQSLQSSRLSRSAESREESISRSALNNVLANPTFVSAPPTRNLAQEEIWFSLSGADGSGVVNVAPTLHSGADRVLNPSFSPHHSRRLSADAEARRQGFNVSIPPLGSRDSSREGVFLNGSVGSQGHHLSRSRAAAAMLGRFPRGAFGIPYLLRTTGAASEGRRRLISEIRNVLDLLRRGEGLQFEDVLILDQSIFYGLPGIHDRHWDMRIDIDNMSYEELLALEEHMGYVNTGLSESTIVSRLKNSKYYSHSANGSLEQEPCCICQEDYNDGEDIGVLECGHGFHSDCIKQWLTHKNLCPICKSTALST